jgi:hypothetical protein
MPPWSEHGYLSLFSLFDLESSSNQEG